MRSLVGRAERGIPGRGRFGTAPHGETVSLKRSRSALATALLRNRYQVAVFSTARPPRIVCRKCCWRIQPYSPAIPFA